MSNGSEHEVPLEEHIFATEDEVAEEHKPAPGTVPDPYESPDFSGVQDPEAVEE